MTSFIENLPRPLKILLGLILTYFAWVPNPFNPRKNLSVKIGNGGAWAIIVLTLILFGMVVVYEVFFRR